ncbi:zinc-ribbon domain-containing protein [Sinomicrobium sp. M5D2P17]
MLIFFGTRASKIKTKRIGGNTECPYCKNINTFVATTFGKYFHIFWIPLFPFSKTTILECSHCKKNYAEHELPEDLKRALVKSNELDPPKRPLWHGCGCLMMGSVLLLIGLFSIAGAIFWSNKDVETEIDARSISLHNDIEKTTSHPDSKTDSISYRLKNCMDQSIYGIDTEKIKYFSKVKEDKLLVLLKATHLKKVEASSRKELVSAVEDCLANFINSGNYQVYIGVNGRWNMVLVKTPHGDDLSGRFAKSNLLLPFYGPEPEKQDPVKVQ